MEKEKKFLLEAAETAKKGILKGGGPFGALVTKNDKVVASAFNKVVLNNDPTAHAEVLAIREAASVLGTYDLKECELYTTCEPCPMCLGAIYWSGIRKVVYSCDRTDAENAGFNDRFIYDELSLEPGKREVAFLKLDDCGAKEVFKNWDKLENKIPY